MWPPSPGRVAYTGNAYTAPEYFARTVQKFLTVRACFFSPVLRFGQCLQAFLNEKIVEKKA